jgi:hypothetical protein
LQGNKPSGEAALETVQPEDHGVEPNPSFNPKTRKAIPQVVWILITFLGTYLAVAYGLVPFLWSLYDHRHPAIAASPTLTVTSDGHPGDPINLALIGNEADLKHAMKVAGWFEADPLSIKDDLKIAEGTILKRPYATAPVSNLFLYGRKEDLAFEQPVGNDPRKRHHVRFWKSEQLDANGLPAWMGSGTFDERVGLSYTTGQITHHVDEDIDRERDHIIDTLQASGGLVDQTPIENFQPKREGRNGGGDRWVTDGRLMSGTLNREEVSQ